MFLINLKELGMPSDGYSELECCPQCFAINMCFCGLEESYREQEGANGVEPECQCPLEESIALQAFHSRTPIALFDIDGECRCDCSKCYDEGMYDACDCHNPSSQS